MAPPGVDCMVREKRFSGRRDHKLSAMNPNEKSKRRRKSEKKEMSRVSRFETGDFVWAKAFPYTWWPGRVYLRGVSTVSVAFFGCDKRRRFCVTDVRDFEEDYPQMIRTVEARLEDEIDRVLEILNYREMLYQHKNDIASPDDTSEHIREPEMSSLSEVDELRHPSKNAAYQFVKRKSVFGKAMVRFWLDEHESSRRTSIAEVSYQSALDVKSCLKRPDAHREKDQKKLSRVRFSSDNQTTTSDYACDSSEVTRPDISPQMMQLLDHCDQLVCKIKQSLGLESIYSVFTHDFSCIAVMVDEPKC
ncbi:hypothetical protein QJS10_CPA16g01222 [Acorus calamus]|uniref:PWWP domain-containing protein n=1 Tax=Acorus calamus TaxID=4465 RepID=A0AAV9CZU8_ACOCL|nr:hypothetical protein QJS10_CPA16g01222 [Acorus calamus]